MTYLALLVLLAHPGQLITFDAWSVVGGQTSPIGQARIAEHSTLRDKPVYIPALYRRTWDKQTGTWRVCIDRTALGQTVVFRMRCSPNPGSEVRCEGIVVDDGGVVKILCEGSLVELEAI